MKEHEVSSFKEALKQAIVDAVDSKRLTAASQIVVRRAFPLLSITSHYHNRYSPQLSTAIHYSYLQNFRIWWARNQRNQLR